MYKQIWTMVRGVAYDTGEEFTDRNALLILNQQLRDSAHAVATARKAVAIAIAQNEQEVEQHAALAARIADLESRTIAALNQGKEALAREAAETIAHLEAECETSQKAQAVFTAEISRLKANVRNAEARLRDLQRGQRLASATDAAQKVHGSVPNDSFSSLAEAEATLLRLRQRQKEFDLTAKAQSELDQANCPTNITEKLAEAGCGEPLRPSADDVLKRLRNRQSGDAGADNVKPNP